MFILKTIREYKQPQEIYRSVPYEVLEETQFHTLDDFPIIQCLNANKDNIYPKTLFAVITAENTYFIHENESAYLLNEAGKTLQIIHRP